MFGLKNLESAKHKQRLTELELKAAAGSAEFVPTNVVPFSSSDSGCCRANLVRGSLGRNEKFWF